MEIVIRNAVFAICGCLFALLALATLIIYGNEETRFFAVIACLLACFSQFIGQDYRQRSKQISVCAAYCAFAAFIVALGYFVLR